jgi:hypothetical protein
MTADELKAAACAGGVEVEVMYVDGSRGRVIVRYLRRHAFLAYADIADSEWLSIELFVGAGTGWADTLDESSFVEILETGRALNLERMLAYVRRATELGRKYEAELIAAKRMPMLCGVGRG